MRGNTLGSDFSWSSCRPKIVVIGHVAQDRGQVARAMAGYMLEVYNSSHDCAVCFVCFLVVLYFLIGSS